MKTAVVTLKIVLPENVHAVLDHVEREFNLDRADVLEWKVNNIQEEPDKVAHVDPEY